jgi:hypothetical protein
LTGLGNSKDTSSLDTLVTWTQRGKPRAARGAALRALGQLAREPNVSDEQRAKIVKTVSACLEKEDRRTIFAAVNTLRDMGKAAAPTLPALEALEQNEADGRIRNMVKGAIDQIKKADPQSDDSKRLREELDAMKKSQKALQDRLDKLEKGERRVPNQ